MSEQSPSSESERGDPVASQSQEVGNPVEATVQPDRGTIGSLAGILVGLIAAGLTVGLLWYFEPDDRDRQLFSLSEELAAKLPNYIVPPPDVQAELNVEIWRMAISNHGFFLGGFGLFMGVGYGIAHGIYRRSIGAGILAVLVIGILGAAFGGGGGIAGYYAFELLPESLKDSELPPLGVSILAQCASLAILGGGIGLGFGLGTRQRLSTTLNCLVFGLLAGVIVSCAYAFSASLLIPDTSTNVTIPDRFGYGRILWAGLVGVIVGGLIPSAAKPARKKLAG